MIDGKTVFLDRPTTKHAINGRSFLPLVDMFAILSGFVIVLGFLTFRPTFEAVSQLEPLRLVIDVGVVAGLVFFFDRNGHYRERRPFWQEAGEVVLAFFLALLVEAAFLFFFQVEVSRVTVAGYWLIGGALLLTMRYLAKSWLHARGLWSAPAVIVGVGPNARDLAKALLEDPVPAYYPVAFVMPASSPTVTHQAVEMDGQVQVDQRHRLPVIEIDDNPFELVRRFGRMHVMVALEIENFQDSKPFVEQLGHAHKDVEIVLPLRGLPTRRSYQTRYVNHDLTTIRLNSELDARWRRLLKRTFDILGAAALLIFMAPLLLVLGALVLTDGRPIFFGHQRVGLYGKPFRCLKFRSMATDAEARLQGILRNDPVAAEEWRTTRKLKNDPRITRVGAWLRKTSLDELPQLINVLRGEMSLVGPRPVTHEEVEEYGNSRLYYLQTRPGITGLWQISGRNDVDFGRRVHLDTWYAQNWSLLGDILILLMTVGVVLRRRGAY